MTREDLSPIRTLFAAGFEPNYPFPSRTMELPNDDSTISSGSTSFSTTNKDFVTSSPKDFLPGFLVESTTHSERSVKNTVGTRGQPTILIAPSFPSHVSETATTIPLSSTSLPD
jgi:hypothetical protein